MNIIQCNEKNREYFKLYEIASLELHRTALSLFDKLKSKETDESIQIPQEDISKIMNLTMASEIILKKIVPDIQ